MSDAVDYANREAEAEQPLKFEVLSTGIRGKIIPIGATLVDEVVARVPIPEVPLHFNEEKGREEENPFDPAYVQAMNEAQRRQAVAAMETLLLFGVELEEIPPKEKWLPKLQLLEKLGHLDLSGYDFEDPLMVELVYKKFIAIGTKDFINIGHHAGLSRRDVEEAAASFKSK